MPDGIIGRMLFVDLTAGRIHEEELREQDARAFLGGYGLGAKVLYERLPKGTDPLGPDNLVGFLAGPLTGTPLPFVSRYTVVGKSPLTGCWGDANGSGAFGPALKFSGYDAVFVSGCSGSPVCLLVGDGPPRLEGAGEAWGRDTYFTEDWVKGRYGPRAEAACIGPAGERQARIAAVISAKGRAAARAGLGAVMGSKRLKAVVALGSGKVPLAFPEKVAELRKKYTQQMKDGVGFSSFYRVTGTPGYTEVAVVNGDTPVGNWASDVSRLADTSLLCYDSMKAYITKRRTCLGCPMADWGQAMIREGPYRLDEEAHVPEYETTSMFGPNCLNTNYESIVKCNDLCNRYGIDTISAGSAVAFAIRCREEGLLSSEDLDGLDPKWGDHAAIVALTGRMVRGEGIGALLAEGVKAAAERIGKGAERFAVHVGGQELP
jgi:aldehyde:ferredoxin oxidoreductase